MIMYSFDTVHPEIIRAHQMLKRAEAIQGAEYAYGEAVNQARVTKARRFFHKKVEQHLGEITMHQRIALLWFLCREVPKEIA